MLKLSSTLIREMITACCITAVQTPWVSSKPSDNIDRLCCDAFSVLPCPSSIQVLLSPLCHYESGVCHDDRMMTEGLK